MINEETLVNMKVPYSGIWSGSLDFCKMEGVD